MRVYITSLVTDISKQYSWSDAVKALKKYIMTPADLSKEHPDLMELIVALRDYYTANDKHFDLEQIIPDEELRDIIIQFADSSLHVFKVFYKLRTHEDTTKVINFLREAFFRTILRTEIEYSPEDQETFFEDQETFLDAYKHLVFDCIKKNLSIESIERSIIVNTGLDKIVAGALSILIDMHYSQLQTIYIINNL